jgi:hypothetical protein
LELERVRRPSSFCLGYFFSSKNFNYVAKDVNILHLKLGGSDRPSYFPTFTPLGYNPPSPLMTYYMRLVVEMERF